MNLPPSRAPMKSNPIIYQVSAGRRSVTLFSDLRIRVKGPHVNQWCFPSATLSQALRNVDLFARELGPRAKWTTTIDRTDEDPATL